MPPRINYKTKVEVECDTSMSLIADRMEEGKVTVVEDAVFVEDIIIHMEYIITMVMVEGVTTIVITVETRRVIQLHV
jgi:hypothetical protein